MDALGKNSAPFPRRAILTVVTLSHVKYAQALARSCIAQEPECNFYVAVVDCLSKAELSEYSLKSMESPVGIHWLTLEDLHLPDWRQMAFQYTPFEFVCACKPFAMRAVRQMGHVELVYVDADMWLYQPMNEVWEELKTASIILTPHLIQPLPDDGEFPSESEYLRCGTFNGGFIAIRADESGESMLDWWCNRMARDCIVDVMGGVFVDQKWLNLVPGLFPSVKSLRHPGYNAGHWSLSQVSIEQGSTGHFCIGESPLVLFHFSKFLPEDPYSFERQQSRVKLKEMPALKPLMEDYWRELDRAASTTDNAGNRFERLICGTLIEPSWREAVRRRHTALRDIADPFDSHSTPGLVDRYRQLESESSEWRLDWKYAKKRSKLAKAIKKLRRSVLDWWSHR